jgi:hypothetical protein
MSDRLRPLPVREALREGRSRRSVALLEAATKKGLFGDAGNRAEMDRDPALAPLRAREDYRRFRAALPSRPTPPARR